MNQETVINYHYNGMINKLDLRRVLKKSEEFRGIYFSLNDIDIFLKKISTKWNTGEYTKQIVLEDGSRPRVYCTHPYEIDGVYMTEMTDGALGRLYEKKEEVPF